MQARTPDLDEQLDRLETEIPHWAADALRWVRKPERVWVRVPAGLLLIAGGVLSFLPVLGIWMLPLGLALVAVDVPFLRGPVARAIAWGERKWRAWRHAGEARARRQG